MSQLNLRGHLFSFEKPCIMGILNLTPDSFYDGGRYQKSSDILGQVKMMIEEGAHFIDIGAVSSRPSAKLISEKEELERLLESVSEIRKIFPDIYLSIDTFRSGIAKIMVQDYEVDIINDISAGELDKNMFSVIADLQVPYIMMHMKGNPENMQETPTYGNVVKEVVAYLAEKIQILNQMGVNDLIADPGFGFGKTLDHNYKMLGSLDVFSLLKIPLMVGLSRKSMIFNLLGNSPDDALTGTTAAHTIALMKGVDILRVHDVKAASEVIKVVEKLNA
ncbi:MAG: dihydropteroate synthase [Bacteroidetes bacterium]|nr:MAG: dihydropteroate synthase [Bacteroidota bacterium]